MLEFLREWWKPLAAVAVCAVLGLWLGATLDKHYKAIYDAERATVAAKQAQADLARQVEQTAVTDKVDASGAANEQKERIVYRTITKEVTKYVQNPAIAECSLDSVWVQLHNAAAQGSVPVSAGAPADASGPVADATGAGDK